MLLGARTTASYLCFIIQGRNLFQKNLLIVIALIPKDSSRPSNEWPVAKCRRAAHSFKRKGTEAGCSRFGDSVASMPSASSRNSLHDKRSFRSTVARISEFGSSLDATASSLDHQYDVDHSCNHFGHFDAPSLSGNIGLRLNP